MTNNDYMDMLYIFNKAFDKNLTLLILWNNGLKIKCKSITGVYETDTESNDGDYIGEYTASVGDVEVLVGSKDNTISIYNNCIEISLKTIPEKIMLEGGTVLWEREG